ncbi:VOC family protein [Rhodococcus sp. 077-4]|uniref:VOC family protein n=1 Tax=Rhodococcus sp. 077-4 TaxID=2789271 RepID=UPI0039F5D20E
MTIETTTHLNFRGDARAALEFYRSVFGGETVMSTYGDVGMPQGLPDSDNVVFGRVENESGFRIMAYDIPGHTAAAATGATYRENGTTVTDQPFFVSVRAQTIEELQGYWDALSSGGKIVEPLAASAWSPGFGMLTDRYGVTWSLDVATSNDAD